MEDNVLIETPLDPIVNLKPTPPIAPTERDKWTPIVWEIDYTGRLPKVAKLEGITIGIENGAICNRYIHCTPKTARDIFDFILDGGTCYLPCSKKFLSLLACYLPYEDKVQLARGKDIKCGTINISFKGGSFLVRDGRRWGRVFSFWEAFPKYAVEVMDEYNPSPLSLDEFVQLFILVSVELQKNGYSIAVLHSAASIVTSYILSCRARLMFGHIDTIPPETMEHAHQCYKGSRFEGEENIYSPGDYWDIVMSFPSKIAELVPADGNHMKWTLVRDHPVETLESTILNEAYYAFLLCEVTPTEAFKYSPSVLRYYTPFGYRLGGFFGHQINWLTIDDYKFLKLKGLAEVKIADGSFGTIIGEPLFRLRGPMEKMKILRDNRTIGRAIKLASQTASGKMGSMWVDEMDILAPDLQSLVTVEVTRTSPIFNLIYSAHVNGAVRAYITQLALKYNAEFIRADGIKVPIGTKVDEEGEDMGLLKLKASGPQINPDDMLWEGPESTQLLDSIFRGRPDSKTFLYPRKIVRTLRGELIRGKNFNKVGVVDIVLDNKRKLGSRKRIPINVPNIGNLRSEGIKHRPPKGPLELQFIRYQGGSYDYC